MSAEKAKAINKEPQALPDEPLEVSAQEFREAFNEDITQTLNLDTWRTGEDLSEIYGRLQEEIRDAIDLENRTRGAVRGLVFPKLGSYPGAPKGAGVYKCSIEDIQRTHRGLLFNGGVEACDGNRQVHDTLPLTIYQIGVSLVSYSGDQGTWVNRLFRRDLRVRAGGKGPADEALQLLERRQRRGGQNQESRRDVLGSELAGRAIMSHAERAILVDKAKSVWRMGHGNPAPYELITGSGSMDLMIESTKVIRRLIEEHQKFVFVASEPSDRLLLTIGQALQPLEYAIVGSLSDAIYKIVENGHYRMKVSVDMTWDGEELKGPRDWIIRFRDQIAPQVVVGVYRASAVSPAHVFYAHADHAHGAAHIAIADSILQYHRGFPMLIDLADHVCANVFGGDSLGGPVSTAYADAGSPWQYLSERATRNR